MSESVQKIIAVGGMIASGKTTLAKNLSSRLGYTYVPESRNAIKYLNDLFKNPERWAFEIQVAFILEKAEQIRRALYNGDNCIVDRSLKEDKDIFFNYFYSNGFIDDRSKETYQGVYSALTRSLPEVSACIYCKTSLRTVEQRIANRDNLVKYNLSYLQSIYSSYESMLEEEYLRCLILDSDALDWRKEEVVDEIVRRLHPDLDVTKKA